MCTEIKSPYEAINYFIMRSIEHDYTAANYLTKGDVNSHIFSKVGAGTLIKNTISESGPSNGKNNSNYCGTQEDGGFATFQTRKSYICKSIVNVENSYYIFLMQLTLERNSIVSCKPVSYFSISPQEAAMIIKKPEYVTVFEFLGTSDDMALFPSKYLCNSTVSQYNTGKLLMLFYPHNHHVNQKEFQLDDDIIGAIFVQDLSQLVICSNTLENITLLEKELIKSKLNHLILPVDKYEFQEQVFMDYINSDFEDFESFVQMISDDDPFTEFEENYDELDSEDDYLDIDSEDLFSWIASQENSESKPNQNNLVEFNKSRFQNNEEK